MKPQRQKRRLRNNIRRIFGNAAGEYGGVYIRLEYDAPRVIQRGIIYGGKNNEFSGNVKRTYHRIWIHPDDLFPDASLFPAPRHGGVFRKGKPVQTVKLAGEVLYFHYERHAADAAAFAVVFRSFLSVGNEHRRL